jgi:hypothetical protein
MTDYNNLQVKLETSPSPDVSNFQFTFVSPYSTDRFGQTYPADTFQAPQQRVVDTQAEVKSYYPSPMSYSDGDGIEGWDDIGGDIAGTASSYAGQSSLSTAERNIRRRSSKGVFHNIIITPSYTTQLLQHAISVGNQSVNANVLVPVNHARTVYFLEPVGR